MKRNIGTVGMLAAGIPLGFMFLNYACNDISSRMAEPMQSTLDMRRMFDEEKAKLPFAQSTHISIEFDRNAEASETRPHPYTQNNYTITINKSGADRNTIRHELYHIYADHLKNKPQHGLLFDLYYHFYAEPTATIYEMTGLKF